MRLYLDTNVIVDILEDRDPTSADLFLRSLACEHTLVLSSWLFQELANIGKASMGETIQSLLGGNEKVVFVRHAPSDMALADDLLTHFADALHYVLARRYADALVTHNLKDYPFTDLPIGKPEMF